MSCSTRHARAKSSVILFSKMLKGWGYKDLLLGNCPGCGTSLSIRVSS